MEVTRKGYYTITNPKGEDMRRPDGSILRVTSRDECYEWINSDDTEYDSAEGVYIIHCPNREVLRTNLSHAQVLPDPDTPLPAQDQPPQIISTPSVSFSLGGIDSYEMDQHVSDDGISSLTYELSGSLPDSVTLDQNTGTLSYLGGGVEGSTSHSLRVTDAVGSDQSVPFNIVISNTVPLWDQNFNNIELVLNAYNEIDLTSYGVNIEEVHAIASSRNSPDSMLPTGMSLDTSTGILSGTPTVQNEVTVITVAGVNGNFNADDDWSFRSNLSDVITTEIFPDNPSVRDSADNSSGRQAASQWDSSIKLYGNGSLRQEYLDTDKYTLSANWRMPLIGGTITNPTYMDPDTELWVCYTIRFNEVEPRYPFAKSGGVHHQPKLSIIGRDDTSTPEQIVNQAWWGQYRGYYGSTNLWDDSGNFGCGPSDFVWQPDKPLSGDLDGTDPGLSSGNGTGSPWTTCQHARHSRGGLYSYTSSVGGEDGFPDPISDAHIMPVEFWQSHMLHVKRVGSTTVEFEWYFALLGEDWELAKIETFTHSTPEIGELHCTNSFTDMIAEPGVRPTSYRWYDGIIVRTGSTRIPAPGFTT